MGTCYFDFFSLPFRKTSERRLGGGSEASELAIRWFEKREGDYGLGKTYDILDVMYRGRIVVTPFSIRLHPPFH